MAKKHDLNGAEPREEQVPKSQRQARTEENGGIVVVSESVGGYTKVRRLEPENWIYEISGEGPSKSGEDRKVGMVLLGFQWGSVDDEGVNGIELEDLLSIVVDRLSIVVEALGPVVPSDSKLPGALHDAREALSQLRGEE